MTTKPAISVVVPTYQGATRILNTLRSLEKQKMRDFEVVVVIDGSTDETQRVIEGTSFNFPLRVHVQSNKGRAGARNAGAALAQADILVLLDDDLIFEGEVLEKYHTLAGEGHPIVVGATYAVPTSGHDEFFDYAKYLDAKWMSGVTSTPRMVLKNPYLTAANCMINAAVFKSLGGFDGRLRDAEDFDLAVKAFDQGIPILMDAGIMVGHHLQSDFKTYVRRMVEYQNAKRVLLQLNPAVAKYLPAPVARGFVKSTLYKMLSGPSWIGLIDKGAFNLLPRNFRYRLYDLLLTAYSVTRTK